MATIAHCSFNDRVGMKTEQLRGTRAIVVEKDYTSKTCSKCGNIKQNLGSNKTYSCESVHGVRQGLQRSEEIMLNYGRGNLMANGACSVLLL